jgi:hypothetical protein
VRARERGHQPRVGFEHELDSARLELGEHRRIEDAIADALLEPHREAPDIAANRTP